MLNSRIVLWWNWWKSSHFGEDKIIYLFIYFEGLWMCEALSQSRCRPYLRLIVGIGLKWFHWTSTPGLGVSTSPVLSPHWLQNQACSQGTGNSGSCLPCRPALPRHEAEWPFLFCWGLHTLVLQEGALSFPPFFCSLFAFSPCSPPPPFFPPIFFFKWSPGPHSFICILGLNLLYLY